MDKWELLVQEIEKLKEEVLRPVRENHHMGQLSKTELHIVNKVQQIIQQVEQAEQNFYDTVSGSGG